MYMSISLENEVYENVCKYEVNTVLFLMFAMQ